MRRRYKTQAREEFQSVEDHRLRERDFSIEEGKNSLIYTIVYYNHRKRTGLFQ